MHTLRNVLALSELVVILCYAVEGNQDESQSSRDFVTVQIQNGQIRGEIVEVLPGKRVSRFRGVQYGQAPVGENRFKAPKAAERWNGTRDALEYGFSCYQWEDTYFDWYIKGEHILKSMLQYDLTHDKVFNQKHGSTATFLRQNSRTV